MQSSFVENRHRRPASLGRGVDGIDSSKLEHELRASLRGEVRFDAGSRALYATDGSNYRQVPIGVVLPRDADDVRETIAACRRHRAPIVSRGGGTSLAGQCCNVAVVMDMSKYMHHILEINPEEKFARVQPGVILDHLKKAAEKHHLTFAPDPSTHDHCTLGGMIGNNSCGVHSVMGGKTVDNVITMDIVLYDGTRMTVGATSEDEYQKILAEGGRRAEIYRALKALADKYADQIRRRYPDIPRRVSGYNLDDLLPEKGFNVARALVGTEATCVTVLEAKVRLLPNPLCRSLLVLGYPDVYEAAAHVPEVLEKSKPIGLEGLDENLIADMKKKGLHPQNITLLPEGKGWLLVEFGGESKKESDAHAQALMGLLKGSDAPSMKLFDDIEQEQQVWKVRESGLGATALVPGEKPTWEGWEDSAVSPEHLSDYLRDLRALMNKHGYKCSLYGHFGQGCVHTRIDFDLKAEHGISNFRSFIEEAAHLVVRHGGSISGEHGDGQSKAEMLPIMFGDELVGAFREFKRIWDPDNRMNPGKVVDPYKIDQNLRLGLNYNPPALKTHFAFIEDHQSFAEATERCVGVGKCRHTEGGTMCPSFMVTREEMHSTRGRTHLLFEMLQGNPMTGGWRSEAVREALDLCLACKGCKGDCPVNVDMATYKAEFLAHYYEGRLRPLAAYSIGRIYWWARLASKMPRLANFVTQTRPMSTLFKAMGGIATERNVPKFATETFTAWFRRNRSAQQTMDRPYVILWPDTFNNFLTPEVARAAVEVIEAGGWQVKIPQRPLCCGRPLYDYGQLKSAKKLWRQTLDTLRDDIRAGVAVVGLEPSCVAAFRDELPNLFPQEEDARRLCEQTVTLAEFLEKVAHYQPPKLTRRAVVHGHCHHKAIMGIGEDKKLLKKLGLDFELLDSGCCGMAGSFGFEREHYDISLKIGERVLLPAVRQAPQDTLLIADGFSCREQIAQTTDREALHLSQIIQLALHQK